MLDAAEMREKTMLSESEKKLREIIAKILPADERYEKIAQKRWNSIAKPLHGLGLLEDSVCQLAAIQRTEKPCIKKRALLVFCADNGIVEEGVTQTDSHVTALVAKNLCTGATSACKMALVVDCHVFPVDMGMNEAVEHESIKDLHVARGSKNFLKEDAMTREEAGRALLNGALLADELADQGYQLLAVGEMGIGNTTTSSALASLLLNLPPEDVTGYGAGLSAEGLARKIQVIRQGIESRRPDRNDVLDMLSKVGGFDIAGITGCMLGAAARKIPVIIDGLITQVAALLAVRLCPAAKGYLLASHRGSEKACGLLLDALEKKALIDAGFHLGEGTGALALIPLLDMALRVYDEMATFDDIQLEAYKPL